LPPHSRKRGRRERAGAKAGGAEAGGAEAGGAEAGGAEAGGAEAGGAEAGGAEVARPAATEARPPSPGARRPSAEARNAAVRASLNPLAPGERPWPLRIAVVLALLVAVGNIVQAAVGTKVKVGGSHTSVGGSLIFSAVMVICAAGMWQLRYWAALGFQALLGIVIVAFVFVALTANDILRALIAVAVIVAAGTLFWKMVRVLSRLQMPKPPGG
jgi:hypothetical protein